MTRRFVLLAAIALTTLSSIAPAQRADSGRGQRATLRPPVGARRGGGLRQGEGPPADRPLEARVRQELARVVRRQLALDNQQMRSLQQTDQKFEQQRRALMRDERDSRVSLRTALEDSTADQAKIAQYLDRLIQIQRRRVDLLEAEQKELGGFLTPKQRAQYFALRERVMRRLAELQSPPDGGRRGGPPPKR
jgi:hypothetical protein